jgi:hypothetical protein
VNHAAFDGYTCGLGHVLPDATDDEPARHGAGEWRLKSSTSLAGQIENYAFHPMQKFKLRHNPTAGAIRTFVERSSRFQPFRDLHQRCISRQCANEPRCDDDDLKIAVLSLHSWGGAGC